MAIAATMPMMMAIFFSDPSEEHNRTTCGFQNLSLHVCHVFDPMLLTVLYTCSLQSCIVKVLKVPCAKQKKDVEYSRHCGYHRYTEDTKAEPGSF
jgi:hypothetical protein